MGGGGGGVCTQSLSSLSIKVKTEKTYLNMLFCSQLGTQSGWVGWQFNACARIWGGGGGWVCTQSLSSLSIKVKTEKTYLNMLFCSQLGTQSKRRNFIAAAAISKSFLHAAGNAAHQEARATPTHDT